MLLVCYSLLPSQSILLITVKKCVTRTPPVYKKAGENAQKKEQ